MHILDTGTLKEKNRTGFLKNFISVNERKVASGKVHNIGLKQDY